MVTFVLAREPLKDVDVTQIPNGQMVMVPAKIPPESLTVPFMVKLVVPDLMLPLQLP